MAELKRGAPSAPSPLAGSRAALRQIVGDMILHKPKDTSYDVPVSSRDLARAFLGRGPYGRLLLVLSAYFDDSGSHDGAPVELLGGLIATDDEWELFERDWAAVLADPVPNRPRLRKFGLSDCTRGRKAFQGYNQAERDLATANFRKVILDHRPFGFVTAVDKVAWNELVTDAKREVIGEAQHFCFVRCIDMAISYARARGAGERIAVIFDKGIETDELHKLKQAYLEQSDKYPEVAAIGFAKVEDVLPLQGADTVVTESYWYAQEWLSNQESASGRQHFQRYLEANIGAGVILDREKIQELTGRFEAVISEDPAFDPWRVAFPEQSS